MISEPCSSAPVGLYDSMMVVCPTNVSFNLLGTLETTYRQNPTKNIFLLAHQRSTLTIWIGRIFWHCTIINSRHSAGFTPPPPPPPPKKTKKKKKKSTTIDILWLFISCFKCSLHSIQTSLLGNIVVNWYINLYPFSNDIDFICQYNRQLQFILPQRFNGRCDALILCV